MRARILIVEDEMLIGLDVEDQLSCHGYEVIGIAPDEESALMLGAARPDLALVDVNLLDGRTGPEIARALNREHGVTTIFLTANPEQIVPPIAGSIGVITKPMTPSMIEAAVEYGLAVRKGEEASPPACVRPLGG